MRCVTLLLLLSLSNPLVGNSARNWTPAQPVLRLRQSPQLLPTDGASRQPGHQSAPRNETIISHKIARRSRNDSSREPSTNLLSSDASAFRSPPARAAAARIPQRCDAEAAAGLSWDPPPLDARWWEPLRASDVTEDCLSRTVAVHLVHVYGRTSNVLLEWVHALGFTVTHRPPAILVVDGVLHSLVGTAFDTAAATAGWACLAPQAPHTVTHNVTLHLRDVFHAPENAHFGSLFRERVLGQLMLRPIASVRDAVLGFERAHGLQMGGYVAVHLRGLEGKCTRMSELHNSMLLGAMHPPWDNATHTAADVCSMSHRYLAAVMRGFSGHCRMVLAHDRQDTARAADIARRFNAVTYTHTNDVLVDIQLLLRSGFFVGNPASSLSVAVATVRAAAGAPSNFDPGLAYQAGPGRSQPSLRQQLSHIERVGGGRGGGHA
eukprot:m.185358 g.185358  ORF g.185358 m.185358 type:complete len:435 (+) comp15025_c1_seq1:137-1441(+)